jgi:predicted anti-sigma-YlaC factor YlaD
MTCRNALKFLADYLDGNLPLRQRLSYGVHLFLCRNCRDYLDGYRKTIEVSRSALAEPANAAGEPLPEELVQAILAARPRNSNID